MKRLLLLRHAKSDWSMNLPDEQRQLNRRGSTTAPQMGEYMVREGLIPDKVLCSPAVRASETWRLVSKALPPDLRADYVEALYDLSTGANFVDLIALMGGNAQTLLIIGHNPSMEGLARILCASGEKWGLKRMARKYPTAALAVIDFGFDDWSEIAPQTGILERFIRPKDIVKAGPDAG